MNLYMCSSGTNASPPQMQDGNPILPYPTRLGSPANAARTKPAIHTGRRVAGSGLTRPMATLTVLSIAATVAAKVAATPSVAAVAALVAAPPPATTRAAGVRRRRLWVGRPHFWP